MSQQSTASASPKCLPRARLRHQCPRDYELPMSHRSTAAASQKRRFSRLRHQGPHNEGRAVSHQSTAPTPQTCFTRARLRQQCPRGHERAFSHQSTAAASQKCFTRARLTSMSIPRSRVEGLPWVPVFSPVYVRFPYIKRSPLGSRVFSGFHSFYCDPQWSTPGSHRNTSSAWVPSPIPVDGGSWRTGAQENTVLRSPRARQLPGWFRG